MSTLAARMHILLLSPRYKALGAALLAALLAALVWRQLIGLYEYNLLGQERIQVSSQLTIYNNSLSTSLSRRLSLLEGLRAFTEAELGTHAMVSEGEFNLVAAGLYNGTTGIHTLSVAPDSVEQLVFPLVGSEARIGRDLLKVPSPAMVESIRLAIENHRLVVSPPQKINGQIQLFAGEPVYLLGRFWGLVTMTIDLAPILNEAGLDESSLWMALREARTGEVIFGDPAVFERDPSLTQVQAPNGLWDLAAVPPDGWSNSVAGSLSLARLMGLLVVGIVGPLVYLLIDRQQRLELAVATRTRQLDRELADRKRIEQEVRESEEKYRTLFETAADGVLLQTPEGQIVDCNAAASRIFGYSREEFAGLEMFDLMPESVAGVMPRVITRELTTGGAFVETRFKRKGGKYFPAEISTQMIAVVGEPLVIAYIRDITQRKAAEEALRDSEERYRALVETSPDAIALTDLKGRILICNQKAIELYEFNSQEQAVGTSVFDLVAPEDRERSLESMARILKEGKSYNLEYTSLTHSGKRFPCEISTSVVLDKNGRPKGFTGISRDISERKHQAREQAAIIVIASALRTAMTLSEISQNILTQLLGLLKADGAALFLYQAASQESHCLLGVNRWKNWTGLRLSKEEGITGRVISTGQPFVNNDIKSYPHTARLELMGGLNAVAGVPLISQEKTIGALWVGRNGSFREGELRVLMVIADMVANALQRAALYEETQRRLQHLTALHEIDQAITTTQNLDEVLHFLLDRLVAQLGADAADVFLLQPGSNRLRFLAGRGFRSDPAGTEVQFGQGMAGRVAAEGRILHIPDLSPQPVTQHLRALSGEAFITYYGVPLFVKQELRGILEVFHRRPHDPDPEWLNFLETLAGQAALAIDSALLFDSLQHSNLELALSYDRTLEGWARALELRDRETEGHTRRAADRTVVLGKALGMSSEALAHVRRGALLHDIGKLGIPDKILLKPGPLTEDEWAVMRLHPEYARNLMEPIPYLHPALDIPYCHHEHWDGSGYPCGLQGEKIPLAARIFAVVDVWDALTSDRVYRPAWPLAEARNYMQENAGVLFDPRVVEVFFAIGADKWVENGNGKAEK